MLFPQMMRGIRASRAIANTRRQAMRTLQSEASITLPSLSGPPPISKEAEVNGPGLADQCDRSSLAVSLCWSPVLSYVAVVCRDWIGLTVACPGRAERQYPPHGMVQGRVAMGGYAVMRH